MFIYCIDFYNVCMKLHSVFASTTCKESASMAVVSKGIRK